MRVAMSAVTNAMVPASAFSVLAPESIVETARSSSPEVKTRRCRVSRCSLAPIESAILEYERLLAEVVMLWCA